MKQKEALETKIEKEYPNLMGLMVLRNGEKRYENYFHGGSAQSHLHIYSITKSILALLIGIAIDQGILKGVDQRLIDLLPEAYTRKNNPMLSSVTLADLMAMRAPYRHKDSPFIYMKYFSSKDALEFTLKQLGGKGEIGQFRYTPLIGPDIISGVLASVSSQSVFSFAKQFLFDPLNIHVEKDIYFHGVRDQMQFNKATDISGWVCDAKGLHTGGWGLTLTLTDMAKLGQLCLNEGNWEGGQIISSTWMDTCMKEHSRWEQEKLSYGYLWWVEPHIGFSAMGDGGNVIYVNKKEGLVIAMNGMFIRKDKDRIQLIKEEIEPLFLE